MKEFLERRAKRLEQPWTGEWPWQEDLKCTNCDKHICYAYPFDLEGSDFYCDDCFARRTEIAKEIRDKEKGYNQSI